MGRDAALAVEILGEAGLGAEPVPTLDALVAGLQGGAGFAVVTEEALATADLRGLSGWIGAQEEWSDLTFILLTSRGGGIERNPAAGRWLDLLSNVTFLERPFHPTTLVSLARAALRGRRRQYEARARLEDLRETEARLRELNAYLERRVDDALAERKVFADIVMTTEGSFQVLDHGLRFLAVNPAAADDYQRIFGRPARVGATLYEVLAHAPDDLQRAVALWRRALAGEHIDETSWWSAPGLPARAYEMKFRPLRDRQGRQFAAYLSGQDVTERVRDQDRLVQATAKLHETQKMETLGQLTGGVAHDFNNLLTPIIGALDVIRDRHRDDPRSARLIDGALQSGERAKTLVQRLLGFARRQPLATTAVSLRDLVLSMRDLIGSSIGSGIELRMELGDEPAPAMADPNQLELAILNLCVNARDAMPTGGRLALQLESVSVTADAPGQLAPGDYHRLSVIDTGAGMDAETLSHAVEPFYSTKELGKGTGLGLSMVHGLCAQLGGAFVLASALGEGTRAEIWLPALPAQAALPLPTARPSADDRPVRPPLRVLLVDDEDLVRAGTAAMLRGFGHTVFEARGGAEALHRLDAGLKVDAVITDYMMPHMDGGELARRLVRREPDAKVLVITGYARGDLAIGLPVLAKPFRQADLETALRAAIDPPPLQQPAAAAP